MDHEAAHTKLRDGSDSKCNSVYDSGCIDSGFHSGLLSSDQFDSGDIRPSPCDTEPEIPCKSVHSDSNVYYQQQDSGLDLQLSEQFSSSLNIGSDLNESSSKCDSFAPNVPSVGSTTVSSSEDVTKKYFELLEDGDTYLHMAVIHRLHNVVNALCCMAQPALLDTKNIDRQTALHLAVCTGQPDVARRLVVAGASLAAQDLDGNTPLHLASMFGDVHCLHALLEPCPAAARPAELDKPNYDGMMSVHLAACNGHVAALQYLMHAGADMNAREQRGGRTVLHLAVEHGRREDVLQLLLGEALQRGRLQLDATTYAGHTAYQLAVCNASDQDLAVASRLASRGAQPRPFPADESSEDEDDDDEMYHQNYHGNYFPQLTLNGGPINASA